MKTNVYTIWGWGMGRDMGLSLIQMMRVCNGRVPIPPGAASAILQDDGSAFLNDIPACIPVHWVLSRLTPHTLDCP